MHIKNIKSTDFSKNAAGTLLTFFDLVISLSGAMENFENSTKSFPLSPVDVYLSKHSIVVV